MAVPSMGMKSGLEFTEVVDPNNTFSPLNLRGSPGTALLEQMCHFPFLVVTNGFPKEIGQGLKSPRTFAWPTLTS